MHNSQNGTTMATIMNSTYTGFEIDATPNETLLISDCLGCHSSTVSTEDISSIGAPIVYNTSGPDYGFDDGSNKHGLAGGNFYWVRTDDTKGHNVFPDNPDENLDIAPGKFMGCGPPGDAQHSCHVDISGATPGGGVYTYSSARQGCTKCHMVGNFISPQGYHHADDSNTVVGCDLGDTDGFYRFLDGHLGGSGRGACGIEDTDWQSTYAADDHNEYLGLSAAKTSSIMGVSQGHTVTFFCCGCHGRFHEEQNAGGAWVRHPSDAVIPDTGEYTDAFGASGSGTGTYDPQVPVARDDLSGWTGPVNTVTLDDDLVMCLSCHRPHGSPYPDMLRWDYSEMIAGDSSKSGGCFSCHTLKNQTP